MSDADAQGMAEPLAFIEAMKHPLRLRVLVGVSEKPGVTVNQLADRLGEPARRVRYQLEKLVEAGLVTVERSTPRRNARERHYRVVTKARVDSWEDSALTPEEVRRAATSVVGLVIEDIRRAVDGGTFGTRPGHSEVRAPGAVDEVGRQELTRIFERTTEEIEETMRRSARRLDAHGTHGTDVLCALFLFEAVPWPLEGPSETGSSSTWLDETGEER